MSYVIDNKLNPRVRGVNTSAHPSFKKDWQPSDYVPNGYGGCLETSRIPEMVIICIIAFLLSNSRIMNRPVSGRNMH